MLGPGTNPSHRYMAGIKVIGHLVLEKNISEGFYHIREWRPSWSCDPNNLCKLLSPHAKEAS